MVLRLSAAIIGLVWWSSVAFAGLDIPAPHSAQTGVGLISGWICDAETLEVSFDGGPRQFVPYGSERADTRGVCGDTDNGFGLLINYNNLGEGAHTMTLYVDGEAETTRTFTVVTQGEPFIRGLAVEGSGKYELIELRNGIKAEVVWDEATQNLTIVDYFTLDDLLGKWNFHWQFTPEGQVYGETVDFPYELTHIETVDGYEIIRGTGPRGSTVRGGYVYHHLPRVSESSLVIPEESYSSKQFFLENHLQDDDRWVCIYFFWDVSFADYLPPGVPANDLWGDITVTTATESGCGTTVIPDTIYWVTAERIEQ